ncbi:MAG: hypothetical protein Q9165_003843 [Trypethelium subeluteriae]
MSNTVNAIEWQGLGEGLVVDVGGSTGLASKAIAASVPRSRFVIQDQPSMVAKGEAELPPELKDRLTFQAHDFFDLNPIVHADVDLLCLILHEWPDEDAVRVLRNLVPKMTAKSRMLINDSVVPLPGTVPLLQEKYIRDADMMMMSMFNSLERTLEDWESLFTEVDPNLRIINITKPEAGTLSMIEFVKI